MCGGVSMSSQQKDTEVVLVDAPDHPAPPKRPAWLGRAVYCAGSGAVATVVGAGASLFVATEERVLVWCSVTLLGCVAAGLGWGSGPVSMCWKACCRWLRGLAAF